MVDVGIILEENNFPKLVEAFYSLDNPSFFTAPQICCCKLEF